MCRGSHADDLTFINICVCTLSDLGLLDPWIRKQVLALFALPRVSGSKRTSGSGSSVLPIRQVHRPQTKPRMRNTYT